MNIFFIPFGDQFVGLIYFVQRVKFTASAKGSVVTAQSEASICDMVFRIFYYAFDDFLFFDVTWLI